MSSRRLANFVIRAVGFFRVNAAGLWLRYSLNSLSVRVPHNLSSRVSVMQTPDPLPGCPGFVLRLPGARFTVKPMVFQCFSASLLVKPMVFQQVRWPDL